MGLEIAQLDELCRSTELLQRAVALGSAGAIAARDPSRCDAELQVIHRAVAGVMRDCARILAELGEPVRPEDYEPRHGR